MIIFQTILIDKARMFLLDLECTVCPREFDADHLSKRPTKETFNKYLSFFLNDLPDANCAKAGRPAYLQVAF